MNFKHFRIFLPFIALALIVLSVVLIPGAEIHIPTFLLFFIIVAAALIASHLPITMQERMKRYPALDSFFVDIILIFGTLFIGLLLYLQGNNGGQIEVYEASMSELLTGGLILCIVGGIRLHRTIDFDLQDERAKKFGVWGIAYSWYLAYFFVVFALLAYALGLPLPSTELLLLLLILIMPISAYVLQFYFYHKRKNGT